ncbi:MAG: C1 family peptidase [Saprospiraceae bacterium]|nr:C1 family peptidase [Saprospiraceae bacterium]
MKVLLTIALLLQGVFTYSQDFSAGLIFEDETYDTQPRQSAEDGSKADLPALVDLTPYCPEVRHQGYIFSCVGWAAGYGAMSIQRAVMNQCTDKAVITRNAHSALFLYNQIKMEDCNKGSRISDALQFLTEKGDCLANQFDFDVNNCAQQPDSVVSKQARRFAIQDFLTLFGVKESPELKVLRVKRVLARNKPVVVGMSVLRNFYDLKNAVYWHPEIGNATPAGGHAMVVVGYDDRKEAFRLMNSWGKNWGDNGFIWVKYKDFGTFCKYAYALYFAAPVRLPAASTDSTNIPAMPLTELAGAFQFRAFTGWSEHSGQPLFENVEAACAYPVYQLHKKDWQVGQAFQMLASTLKEDEYLYVFSVDANKDIHFHWPRQAGLNEKFEGMNESGLMLAGGADIVIPGANKVLKLAAPGTDRLVLLFSKRKIETIQKLAIIATKKEGDFAQNLLQTLGKHAVPPSDITYAPNKIAFSAATLSEGFIVPLILEVQAR